MTEIYRLTQTSPLDRSIVGAKADELNRLIRSGAPVPPGIVLATGFFSSWMERLTQLPAWASATTSGPGSDLSDACAALQQACSSLELEDKQRAALDSVAEFCPGAALYAVRSSAIDEDLDGASFAGAYETVLGVRWEKLEDAIRHCFASIFDERIFVYKRAMGCALDQAGIALIVQEQLPSDVSGVAFSLNPLNNDHDEALINANWGQGEAVVSGLVSPDSFTVNKASLEIVERITGEKHKSIWLLPEGGVVERDETRGAQLCLDDGQITELVRLLRQVEAAQGVPVDVEWALVDDSFYLLQARPITTFHPVPPKLATYPGDPRRLFWDLTISVHGILEPLSPMGASVIERLIAAARKEVFGVAESPSDPARRLPTVAGGRLYLDLNNLIALGGIDKVSGHLELVDPLAGEALLAVDLEILASSKLSRLRMVLSALPRMPVRIRNVLRALRNPHAARNRWEVQWKNFCAALDRIPRDRVTPEQYVHTVLDMTLRIILRDTLVQFIASRIALGRIGKLFREPDDEQREKLAMLEQGLPGNVTIEMGLELHRVAQELARAGETSLDGLLDQGPNDHSDSKVKTGWTAFLEKYGHRGPREIDAAAPRFRDEPAVLLQELAGYLGNDARDCSPEARFREGQAKREEAANRLASMLGQRSRSQRRAFEKYYAVVEQLGGFRETHKFVAVLAIDRIRTVLLATGKSLALDGRLTNQQDVFFLRLPELKRVLDDPSIDAAMLVESGKAETARASRCKAVFPVMDSRGRFYHPSLPKDASNGAIIGHAVSSGVAKGRVKVLSSPTEKPIEVGDILVARATDPGWTPLFVNASAIVLEVGGALQHGALVAREYGKPCVSGVFNATSRLRDGEEVEVDGNMGIVRRLEQTEKMPLP